MARKMTKAQQAEEVLNEMADRERVKQQYGMAEKKEDKKVDLSKVKSSLCITGTITEWYAQGEVLRYIDKDGKTVRFSKVRDAKGEVVRVYEKDEDGEETPFYTTIQETTELFQFIIQKKDSDELVHIRVNPKKKEGKEKSALKWFMEALASQYDVSIDYTRITSEEALRKTIDMLANKGTFNFKGTIGEGYTKPQYWPDMGRNHRVTTHKEHDEE